MNALEKVEQLKKIKYDINEHLDTLVEYGRKCESITEFGVYLGFSLWAFAAAQPKVLRAYDIKECSGFSPSGIAEFCRGVGCDFRFSLQDVVAKGFEIEKTDLLFIDTLHTYKQLSAELKMHGNKASKFIILHATEKFKHEDQHLEGFAVPKTRKKGLHPAMEEFLTKNPQWKIKKHFEHNNGLTILERGK